MFKDTNKCRIFLKIVNTEPMVGSQTKTIMKTLSNRFYKVSRNIKSGDSMFDYIDRL